MSFIYYLQKIKTLKKRRPAVNRQKASLPINAIVYPKKILQEIKNFVKCPEEGIFG